MELLQIGRKFPENDSGEPFSLKGRVALMAGAAAVHGILIAGR